MRRSQNEIVDINEIETIIQQCDVVHIGMSQENVPYVIPMNYGYSNRTFYFHGAKEGRKIDIIKVNPKVCFQLDTDHRLITSEDRACDWTMKYASVIGYGVIKVVEDLEEKVTALDLLMQHYGGEDHYTYGDKMLERICILKLEIDGMTGKRSN